MEGFIKVIGATLLLFSVFGVGQSQEQNCTTTDCITAEIERYIDNLEWGAEFEAITGIR
jgi:hypothetical protein